MLPFVAVLLCAVACHARSPTMTPEVMPTPPSWLRCEDEIGAQSRGKDASPVSEAGCKEWCNRPHTLAKMGMTNGKFKWEGSGVGQPYACTCYSAFPASEDAWGCKGDKEPETTTTVSTQPPATTTKRDTCSAMGVYGSGTCSSYCSKGINPNFSQNGDAFTCTCQVGGNFFHCDGRIGSGDDSGGIHVGGGGGGDGGGGSDGGGGDSDASTGGNSATGTGIGLIIGIVTGVVALVVLVAFLVKRHRAAHSPGMDYSLMAENVLADEVGAVSSHDAPYAPRPAHGSATTMA